MKKLSLLAVLMVSVCAGTFAQNHPITAAQKSTAQKVAQAGVPLEDLAPNAPESHTVKSGDTLWAISGLFLKTPWRWPELWGMNLNDVRNPHRIYPGQLLVLEKSNGRARLRMGGILGREGDAPMDTIKVSPRTRTETLADAALPTLSNRYIEPFLSEPVIVDEAALTRTPRIVATQEGRVLLSRGDRAYALGDTATPVMGGKDDSRDFRVFRNVTPLKDPVTGTILGYEAQYVGKARVAHGQTTKETPDKDGKPNVELVPATIDIIGAKEEMRVGDRLLPEPPRQFTNFVPRAPEGQVDGRIVSVYGSAVVNAAQNQVVVIDKGTRDGLQVGHVMAVLKDGARVLDRTTGKPEFIKLPDERNGLLMVFRPFETLSYALILEITDGVKIGDKFTTPK
ncbi:MAG: LysM peptidoglycan-binding domain-containing protein [Betaproteobacteria bacterium]|jgi:LysM repeat protein|nr:LysM peptidoglycan-binding domain-containing protein [Betaproteobacteria bacterium]